MAETQDGLTIDELAERVDVPVRTIRFYISQGLLPGPGSRGKSATYGEEHVTRLRLIRRLADQRVPLAKIAELVEGLTLDETRALLAREERRMSELQAAEELGSPKDYVGAVLRNATGGFPARSPRPSLPAYAPHDVPVREPAPYLPPHGQSYAPSETWRHWTLAPGVELHVRGDALARSRELIRRLLAAAGVASDPADD